MIRADSHPRYIGNALTYIEKHLSSNLSSDDIAERHFVSPRQLYRDFYAITGHSVKEYIRKRRISNACERIKCSAMSLSVIADESGYQTQQAFHKQFRSIVGMTPLEYRKSDSYYYFYPSELNETSFAVKVGAETIPDCATTRFYDSNIVGIEDKAIAALGDIANYGRVFGRNGKQIGNQMCYEIMTEIEGAGRVDLYAVCTVSYAEEEINSAWNYLYNVWLSMSMFESSGDGYFEEYIFRDGKPHKLKLYLPVKKRKLQHRISIESVEEMTFVTAREIGRSAEKRAAERVMAVLGDRYPFLIQNARRFFVCVQGDSRCGGSHCGGSHCGGTCECGIECGKGFNLPTESELEIRRIPQGMYAVLPDDCLGDIGVGEAKLNRWLQNNGIQCDNDTVFAVYESRDGKFDSANVAMNLYKRLKNDKNG